jgi:hypothetical protein
MKRITEHPLTSIAGIIIWIISSAMFYQGKIDLDTWLMGLGLGAVALGLKDRWGRGAAPVVALAIGLLFSGCRVTYEKCQEKYGYLGRDSIAKTVEINAEVPVTTNVPGDSVDAALHTPLSSDIEATQWAVSDSGRAGIGIVTRVVSATGRASLQYWLDSSGTMHVKCNCNPVTIHDTVKQTVRVPVACPPPVIFQGKLPHKEKKESPGRLQVIWDGFRTVAGWLLLIGILLLFIILIIRIIK